MEHFTKTMLTCELLDKAEKLFDVSMLSKKGREIVEYCAYVACVNFDTETERFYDFLRVLSIQKMLCYANLDNIHTALYGE